MTYAEGRRPTEPVRRPVAFLVAACAVVIALGIFFRLHHVDHKVYWDDEIYTSIHALGLTEAEIISKSDRLVDGASLHEVIHPRAGVVRPVSATVFAIETEDTHHSPLYYMLIHFWVKAFGTDIATIRMLSVVFGLLSLPCMYWLCRELFGTAAAGWLGTTLLAISPVSVLYGQEAREYSLWTLVSLLGAIAFLRALRIGSPSAWASYALAVAAALYVYPFAIFVVVANTVFTVLRTGLRSRAFVSNLSATAAGLIAFAPWIVAISRHIGLIDREMVVVLAARLSPLEIARLAGRLFALGVLDIGSATSGHGLLTIVNLFASAAVLALGAYLIRCAAAARDEGVSLYIAIMLAAPVLPLLCADLFTSGNRIGEPRYVTPVYLAIDLAFVYLFIIARARWIARPAELPLWVGIFAIVFCSRIISCAASDRAQTWWNKYYLQAIPVAQRINQTRDPLILSDDYVVWSLVLANYLKPDIMIEVRPRCFLCSIRERPAFRVAALAKTMEHHDVFLLGPSRSLQTVAATAMQSAHPGGNYTCIDVKHTCTSELHFW